MPVNSNGNGHQREAGREPPAEAWPDMIREVLAQVHGNMQQMAEAQGEAMMRIAHRLLDLLGEQSAAISDLQLRVVEMEAERPSHSHSEARPQPEPPT